MKAHNFQQQTVYLSFTIQFQFLMRKHTKDKKVKVKWSKKRENSVTWGLHALRLNENACIKINMKMSFLSFCLALSLFLFFFILYLGLLSRLFSLYPRIHSIHAVFCIVRYCHIDILPYSCSHNETCIDFFVKKSKRQISIHFICR